MIIIRIYRMKIDCEYHAEAACPAPALGVGQGIAAVFSEQSYRTGSSNPTKTAASSTDLRVETTAFAGKLSSGHPRAMLFMIT